MKEIRILGALPANTRLLDEQMRAGVPRYVGLAIDTELRVFLDDGALGSDEAKARAIVAAHDASQVSGAEAAEKALLDFIEGLNGPAEIARIDAISNLEEAKVALRRVTRGLLRLCKLLGYAVALDE